MNLNFRRFIYINAILLFFVAASLIIFYTSGYKFDIYQRSVKATGSLFITTQPSDAQVYLNEELMDGNTPLRLNQLTPNSYSVKIEKEGFQSWHKKLTVKEKQTSFADNIILWPENPKINLLINDGIKNFSIDPQERFVLFQNLEGIQQYNISTKITKKILELTTSDNFSFTWSDDGQYVILSHNNQYWLYTVDNNIYNINKNISNDITNLKFHPNNTSIITYIIDGTLYSYNINTRTNKKISNDNIHDYLYQKNTLYTITNTEPVFLTTISTTGEKFPLFQLPYAHDYEIADIIKNQALIYSPSAKILYLFTLDAEEFNNTSNLIHNVDSWEISQDQNTILLNNSWEIWTYNIEDMMSNLITRVSTPISETAWYYDNNYIIAIYPQEIQLIEIDNRDFRNTASVWQVGTVYQSYLQQNGEYLYLLADKNNKKSLLTLELVHFDSILPDILGN